MFRFLFLLIVFCLGIGAAVVWFGQMYHVRLAVPDDLPAWSDLIDEEAKLTKGELVLPATAIRPAMTLGWAARLPDQGGLNWDLTLTGQGVDLRARLVVPFWPDRAQIRDGAGTVLLADLAKAVGLSGLLRVDRLSGAVEDLFDTQQPNGSFSATLQRITIQGAELGEGPLRIDIDPAGQIDGTFALRGGQTDVDGTLNGTIGAALGQLDLVVQDVTALPAAARGPLEALGQRDGKTVALQLPVPLR